MKKSAEEVLSELKEDISTYAELKLELIKLNAYEQSGKVLAVLSYGLLLFALVATAVLFILLTLGFLLSEWLHSTIAGFGIVAALYLVQIAVLILNRNRIRRKIMNIVISALNTNGKKNDAATNPEPGQTNPE
jgi:Protein of unknown function (DUF1469).